MEMDLRKWLGFLEGETRHLGRELTTDEIELCRDIYADSDGGWRLTKHLMRKALRNGGVVR